MSVEIPKIYVKEGNAVIEKEAPLVEHQCWWCGNALMYKVTKPGIFVYEIYWYQCPKCGAREDMHGLNLMSGIKEAKK